MWPIGLGPQRSQRLIRSVRTFLIAAAFLPLAVPLLESTDATRWIGQALRRLYGLQCHQRIGRSFAIVGIVLPVCARCYGIYLGLGLAGLFGRPRLRANAYKAWILIGSVLLLVDVASEWVGLRPESAWIRTSTGALLAYGIALAMLEAVRPRRHLR